LASDRKSIAPHWSFCVTEEQVLSFVGMSVRSVWALELLLILRRNRERTWSQEELIRESRSSLTAVVEALIVLNSSGMVATEADRYRYAPASQELEEFGGELEKLYSVKPLTVIKAIVTAPQDKLQTLADAFKFRNT
jgi:hypothetical protein